MGAGQRRPRDRHLPPPSQVGAMITKELNLKVDDTLFHVRTDGKIYKLIITDKSATPMDCVSLNLSTKDFKSIYRAMMAVEESVRG
jgi:hypothetical protein